jgi:hypothetical protein
LVRRGSVKKTLLGVVVLCGLLGICLVGIAVASNAVDGDEPAIKVSPNVIVLAKVSTVTVHSNIVASAVEPGSIDLDGAIPTSVGADSLGHLVAKFALADLGLEPGEASLTLSGTFKDGGAFSASDMVTVK